MKTILLDMDGVVANFHEAACNLFGTSMEECLAASPLLPHEYCIEKYISAAVGVEIRPNDLWDAINRNGQFWLEIEPYDWIEDLWRTLLGQGCNIIVSSNPDIASWNTSHKITWLRQHLPELHETSWMLGKHKHLMAKPDHILIDDCDHNIDLFRKHGGIGILFPQPWNSNYQYIGNRVSYVQAALKGCH